MIIVFILIGARGREEFGKNFRIKCREIVAIIKYNNLILFKICTY